MSVFLYRENPQIQSGLVPLSRESRDLAEQTAPDSGRTEHVVEGGTNGWGPELGTTMEFQLILVTEKRKQVWELRCPFGNSHSGMDFVIPNQRPYRCQEATAQFGRCETPMFASCGGKLS
jgi:hypothetical protein